MYETHKKGEIATLKVQLRATEKGWITSRPTVESRYDLVLDNGIELYRVQVKYVSYKANEAFVVDLRKQCRNNGVTKVYSASEVDVVIAYLESTDALLWIPTDLFDGRATLNFRVEPAKNGQEKGIRYAKDFIW